MSKRILVVTSCTGEKAKKPENQLVWDDFQDKDRLVARQLELDAEKMTAGKLYTGKQHTFLMNGIYEYREKEQNVDVAVLSAGFGILDEDEMVVPYEVTFNNMTGAQIQAWSNNLEITQSLERRIQEKEYDLIFFLLGDKYLQAISWPIQTKEDQKLIFFAGHMSKKRLQCQPHSTLLLMGNKEASYFGGGLIWLKGLLFSKLVKSNLDWDVVYNDPASIRNVLLETSAAEQLEFFEESAQQLEDLLPVVEYVPPYFVADDKIALNYQQSLSYFMPENDDRVDPRYDFEQDQHFAGRVPLDDFYAHQFYEGVPQYDGILISKVNIDRATQRKKQLIEENGIRNFLRLPDTTQIMGDCGAFSYITMDNPPYTTLEVLDYYQSLGFDYGVSVDHLIVGPWKEDEATRLFRYELTIANAESFIQEHRRENYRFTPIGVVQGWNPESFRDAVQALQRMGYEYVALGGLAKEQSSVIFDILKAIAPVIDNPSFRMHLFGVARDMETMHAFHKLGVTSFDSASPLRRAWMDSKHNYYTNHGDTYTALRLPEALEGKGRLKEITDPALFQHIKGLERNALALIRSYGNGHIQDVEPVLEALLAYDEFLGGNRRHHPDAYRRLLEDRPWEQCGCPICSKLGIDVVIFRGNNRNRRRGFHNTHVYHSQLKELRRSIDRT